MSYFFKPIHTHLSAGNREVIIEPIFCYGINENGWHAAGVYQIAIADTVTGQLHFEGTQWHYEGAGLSEIEQEELAYFIRFYKGEMA